MPLQPGEVVGWLRAFAFTQAVEVPLYLLALTRLGRRTVPPSDGSFARRVGLAFLCSLVTHPVVWFVFPRLIDSYADYELMVVAAESFAVTVEALLLFRLAPLPLRSAFALSFAVNMTSMSLGFLSRYLFDAV
jgi:hypothetical protein